MLTTPIAGPAVWSPVDLHGRSDWVHELNDAEKRELEQAVARLPDNDHLAEQPLATISRGQFALTALAPRLAAIREQVLHGTGFVLVRGLPLSACDDKAAARMLWGLGLHLGLPQPQDAAGALIHHVRDTGANVAGEDNVRTYETREAQPWHNDGGDVFALMCKASAARGGRSFVASAHTAFNEILRREPKLAAVLQAPFYFDARGQQLPGTERAQRVPIFTWYRQRLYALHKRHYIEHAQRFPEVPALTSEQREALDLLEEVCDSEAVCMTFEMTPGDLELGHNFTLLHKRSEFDQGGAELSRRHMLRLWLGLPDGWPLPPAYTRTREFGHLMAVRSQV
jgi:hypothetical protein